MFRFGGDFLYGHFIQRKERRKQIDCVFLQNKSKKKDNIFFDGGYQYFRFKFGFRIKFHFCIKKSYLCD